jgi:hypothetical protein
MERAERMIAIAAGLIFSAVLVPILWVMLALTLFTAGHRFVMVWRQANAPRRVDRPQSPWSASRWRGWTPSVSFGTTAARRERQRGSSARRRSQSGAQASTRGTDRRAAGARRTDTRGNGPRATDSSAADPGAWRRRARTRP